MRVRALYVVAVVVQAVLLAVSGANADSLPTADEVLAKIDAGNRGVESGVFLARHELPGENLKIETEVWFDGVRFRVENRQVMSWPGRETVTEQMLYAFDGERVIETRLPDMSLAREAAPTRLEDVGRYASLGGINLLMNWHLSRAVIHGRSLREEVLAHAGGYVESVSREDAGDESCIVLSAPRATTPGRFWICPDKDYAVARYEYDAPSGRLVVFEVQEWMAVGGSWLPRVAVGWTADPETGEATATERCELVSAAFNIPVSGDRFQIALPEATVREPFADLD